MSHWAEKEKTVIFGDKSLLNSDAQGWSHSLSRGNPFVGTRQSGKEEEIGVSLIVFQALA